MIGIDLPADMEMHDRIRAAAPIENLPVLSTDEMIELESLRDRYDVLMGIVDADDVGVSVEIATIDVTENSKLVKKMDGKIMPYFDYEDAIEFIATRTTITRKKIKKFLYEEEIEIAACCSLDLSYNEILIHLHEIYNDIQI